MTKINDRYKELLSKYAVNDEIMELMDLVVLDYHRWNEEIYMRSLKYPERQDLLGKLKMDLTTTKVALEALRTK